MPERPQVVLHNAVSLDGSISGVEVDLGLFYRLAGRFRADAMLVGSATARTGIAADTGKIPAEQPDDLQPPPVRRGDRRPRWFIIDSRGTLKGMLHVLRRSGYCRDVVVVLSRETPGTYIEYLKQRKYDFIIAGARRVDLKRALEVMASRYRVGTVQVDSGGVLASALLDRGLVDRVSLLVMPAVVGRSATHLFRDLCPIKGSHRLTLTDCRRLPGNCLHLVYSLDRQNTTTIRRKQ